MATDNRVRLAGALGSPYTQKMVALLRYRRLPYDVTWGDPGAACDTLGVARPSPVFMPTFFFANDAGELQAVCDSTPIIRRLEDMSSGRSVLPADPALAFIDYLIEDFADEWCTKYMFHYRWHYPQDAANAAALLPLGLDVSMDGAQWRQSRDWIAERQIGRLYVVGSNDTTAPVIDASYRRFLTALESHLACQPFMLGRRPGAGISACTASSPNWWASTPLRGPSPTRWRPAPWPGSTICATRAAWSRRRPTGLRWKSRRRACARCWRKSAGSTCRPNSPMPGR